MTEFPPLVRAFIDGLVEEAREHDLVVELYEGKVPYIPADKIPTLEDKQRALDFVKTSRHVGGARIFAEGIVLEPAKARVGPPAWPYTEPEIVERYGLEPPG